MLRQHNDVTTKTRAHQVIQDPQGFARHRAGKKQRTDADCRADH
jgi:hypothetical protein